MGKASRAVIFLAGAVVGALALGFVAIAMRHDALALLGLRAAADTAAPTESVPVDGLDDTGVTEGDSTAVASESPVASSGSYSAAVRLAAPAVVNIYVARVVAERVPYNFLQDPFGEFWPRYRRRVEQSLGSGVIVDPSGQIVTNHHVVADADQIQVQLADGRVAEAKVVGRDPDTDLALLRIDLPDLPSIRLGRSDALAVGDIVLAIGNPIGLSQTVTQGIVSATGRAQLGLATYENFIQTDAPINVGNSGGALINSRGELVGINTAVIAKTLGVEGIGFAIPVNLVRGVINEINTRGRVVRGWIGIATDTVDEARAKSLGLPAAGVVIVRMTSNSPAQRAGLRPGDLILSIDGKAPKDAREVLLRIADTTPGEPLKIEWQRGNEKGDTQVIIDEAPQQVRGRN
ncbi:MAG: trypsin-like peptidase domain-containing protein [Acidibacter sp.]|jgi:serine protease DegS|nr:trypsin-like peptidase domain-containing protein [Acidibacter sp.]